MYINSSKVLLNLVETSELQNIEVCSDTCRETAVRLKGIFCLESFGVTPSSLSLTYPCWVGSLQLV